MNKSRLSAALAAALALALSGATLAAMPPPVDDSMTGYPAANEAELRFDELDKDADGFVVANDIPVEHELALQFAVADLDQDQRLSRHEFDAFQEDPGEEEAEE